MQHWARIEEEIYQQRQKQQEEEGAAAEQMPQARKIHNVYDEEGSDGTGEESANSQN